jgi:hypothetical protein
MPGRPADAAGNCGRWKVPFARTTFSAVKCPPAVSTLKRPLPLVQLHRRGNPLRAVSEQVSDGVAGEESIRLGIVVGQPGQYEREVGVFT